MLSVTVFGVFLSNFILCNIVFDSVVAVADHNEGIVQRLLVCTEG